jgi:hypothetical protein
MAEPKTKATKAGVSKFLNAVSDKTRRDDCFAVLEIMREITKEEPVMWGSSIVGFGRYRLKYESGRQVEWPIAAFSPRKGDLTLYISPEVLVTTELMERLGKYKIGKSCLYIKKLADVDPKVLRQLISKSIKEVSSQRVK